MHAGMKHLFIAAFQRVAISAQKQDPKRADSCRCCRMCSLPTTCLLQNCTDLSALNSVLMHHICQQGHELLCRYGDLVSYMRYTMQTTHIILVAILPRGGWTLSDISAYPNRFTTPISQVNGYIEVLPSVLLHMVRKPDGNSYLHRARHLTCQR